MNFIRTSKEIKYLYDMYRKGELILQPFFQRNLVWSKKGKSRFIESILLKLPISEVYLYQDTKDTISVIDGQQRLSTIFAFIERKFNLAELEQKTNLDGLSIDFLEDEREVFLDFPINYVLISNEATKSEIIDMYSRINEYTVNLNEQELRKAAHSDSEFLKLSEELSLLEFFEYAQFFSKRKRERMNDVEFISELLALQIYGIQDKKTKLNDYYANNTKLDNYKDKEEEFKNIIIFIESLFSFPAYFINEKTKYDGLNASKNFGKTRFKQQADFYSFFKVVQEQLSENSKILLEEEKEKILKILLILDELIEPESLIDILSTYAVKCVSQGNTKNSREFRYKLLKKVFTFVIDEEENELISILKEDFEEIFEINIDFLNFDYFTVSKQIKEFKEALKEK